MQVVHEPAEQRFVLRQPQGQGALLYAVPAPGVLDLYHAEVATSLRGKGLAGVLVEAACEHARARGLKLIPTCPYVAWWFGQHPEQQDLLLASSA